jgi:hypothetical protein
MPWLGTYIFQSVGTNSAKLKRRDQSTLDTCRAALILA